MFVTRGRVREALGRTGVRLGRDRFKNRANRGSHIPGFRDLAKILAGLGKGYQDKGFAKFAHGCSVGEENG